MIAELILYAKTSGYELTFGDAFRDDRCPYGQKFSLHKKRLAIDFNLFVDGAYITSSDHPAYQQIGHFWESLAPDCAWGGRWGDGNHFSLEHDEFK